MFSKPRQGRKIDSPRRKPWDQAVDKIEKPRQGRKIFNGELLSPLTGLRDLVVVAIPTAYAVGYKYVAPDGATIFTSLAGLLPFVFGRAVTFRF